MHHAISRTNFGDSENSCTLPQSTRTWSSNQGASSGHATLTFSRLRKEGTFVSRSRAVPCQPRAAQLDGTHTWLRCIAEKSVGELAPLSDRLYLPLWRLTSRCSFSQWSSLIDSAFCFSRSSRYSCPRFAKSDSVEHSTLFLKEKLIVKERQGYFLCNWHHLQIKPFHTIITLPCIVHIKRPNTMQNSLHQCYVRICP